MPATSAARRDWRCHACKSPITDQAGYVEIVDNRTGDWQQYDPDAPSEAGVLDETESQVNDAKLFFADPGVSLDVYCDACRSSDEATGYIIGLDRVPTLESWCTWVDHVGAKSWMRKRDTLQMLRFWWSGHGEEFPPLT